MTVRESIQRVKNDPKEAWYFVQGSLRLFAYRRLWLRWLLRWHIREQFVWRKKRASSCYLNGECWCCGCETPGLFFASKACKAGSPGVVSFCQSRQPCYPPLLSQTDWYWYALRSGH